MMPAVAPTSSTPSDMGRLQENDGGPATSTQIVFPPRAACHTVFTVRDRPDVLVIGAGVSGLSTALCLAEDGINVEVVARQLPLETTSCAAAAMWAPYLVADARLTRWSLQTHDKLITLGPEMGVRQ